LLLYCVNSHLKSKRICPKSKLWSKRSYRHHVDTFRWLYYNQQQQNQTNCSATRFGEVPSPHTDLAVQHSPGAHGCQNVNTHASINKKSNRTP